MNALLRIRLVYYFLFDKFSKSTDKTEHVVPVAYTVLLLNIFLWGCWSIVGLLSSVQLTAIRKELWLVGILAASLGIVYITCLRNRAYLQVFDYLKGIEASKRKKVLTSNGLFFLFICLVPQVTALVYMVFVSSIK